MDGYNENRDRQSLQEWASLFNNMKSGVKSGASSAWEAVKDGFSKIPSPADNMRRIVGNTSQAGVPQAATFSGEDPIEPYSVSMPYARQDFVTQMQPQVQEQPMVSPVPRGALSTKKQPGLPAGNPNAPTDPTYADLLKQIHAKGNATAELQRGAADNLQPFVDRMQQGDLQYDLTPLMALIDTRTGSNLAQSYKSPETGKERMGDLMKLKNNLSQMGIQASDTELAALKDYATGTMGLDRFNADQDYRKDSLAVQQEQNAVNRARLATGPGGLDRKPSEAEKSVDRAFGKRYDTDIIGGNFAGAGNELAGLKSLSIQIESGKLGVISGPDIGAKPEWMRKIAHPEAEAARQQILKSVGASLRETLGSAFTQKEGDQIFARTFDPMLSPKENTRRLNVLVDSIEKASQAKMRSYKHYEEFGTMRGFKGSTNFEQQFKDSVNFDPSANLAPSAGVKDLEDMTEAEIDAELARLKGG